MTNFTTNYTEVNENLAKRAKEMNSFSDYKQGTATEKANYYTDEIIKYANELLERKPTEETRNILKSNGFKWSPSQTAWQRLLNGNAMSALERIKDK